MGCYVDGLSKSSLSDPAIEKDPKLKVHWNVGSNSCVGYLIGGSLVNKPSDSAN